MLQGGTTIVSIWCNLSLIPLCLQARQRFPYLQNFDGDWPTKEFIRQAFSDRRKYKVKLQVLTAPGEDDGGEDAADDELGPESDGDSGEE